MESLPRIRAASRILISHLIGFACWAALMLPATQVGAQHAGLRRGDRLYDQQEYAEAELRYREAQNATGRYNAGNAAYQQGQYAEAAVLFREAANTAMGTAAKANAFYNLGNALLQSGRYREAVAAYEKSLRLLPNQADAKVNLRIAREKMREKQEPPPPPPPPPPSRQPPPRRQYVDQARTPRKKEEVHGGLSAEAARRLLEEMVDGEEAEHARQYRELAPAVRPVKGKKDW